MVTDEEKIAAAIRRAGSPYARAMEEVKRRLRPYMTEVETTEVETTEHDRTGPEVEVQLHVRGRPVHAVGETAPEATLESVEETAFGCAAELAGWLHSGEPPIEQVLAYAFIGAPDHEIPAEVPTLDEDDLIYVHNMLSRPGLEGGRTCSIQDKLATLLVGPPEDDGEDMHLDEWHDRQREGGLLHPSFYGTERRELAQQRDALRVLRMIASNAAVMDVLRTSYADPALGPVLGSSRRPLDLLVREVVGLDDESEEP